MSPGAAGDSAVRAVVGRTVVVVVVMLVIAAIHALRVGTYLEDPLFTFYYSYFSDIVIPFGMYFLLYLSGTQMAFLADWRTRALIVFSVSSLTEVLQAFGVPLLGQTFDPLDFVMFAVGTLLAVVVDRFVFSRVFPFWS
ncbi:MAG: hypothetical protein PVG83_12225 [Acidimicrobiia bacterium]|jgi:hypothetical protein